MCSRVDLTTEFYQYSVYITLGYCYWLMAVAESVRYLNLSICRKPRIFLNSID